MSHYDQDWCPNHYDYYLKDEGCQTCKYEEEKVMPKTKFRYEIKSEEFLRIALSFISRKINGETLDYGYYFMTDKGIINLITTDKEKNNERSTSNKTSTRVRP